MAGVNWGLAQQGNSALGAFQTGYQIGDAIRQRGIERQTSSALSGLVADPAQDDAKFAELIKGLPIQSAQALINARTGMQAQQQQAQQQRRADLPFVGRLLQSSTDEASYQRARQVAQQYGVDLAGAPETFDPVWRDQQLTTVQALSTPQGQQVLSAAGKIAADEGLRPGTPEFSQRVTQIWRTENQKTVPYAAGGGVAAIDPTTGGVSTLIAPNTTGAPVGSPVQSGPQVGSVVGGYRFKGGNPNDRANWEQAGGGSGNATGGFR